MPKSLLRPRHSTRYRGVLRSPETHPPKKIKDEDPPAVSGCPSPSPPPAIPPDIGAFCALEERRLHKGSHQDSAFARDRGDLRVTHGRRIPRQCVCRAPL